MTKKERKRLKRMQKQALKEEYYNTPLNLVSIREIIRKNFLFMLLLPILVFALYFNSLDNQITLVDDLQSFVLDERVADLGEAFRTLNFQKMVYGISYQFFEYSAVPLRVISVSLHAVNSLLVFIFVYLLFGRKISYIATLIFVTHSVNTEAVTWISGSPYLYISFFIYLVMIMYLLYQKSQNKRYLYYSLAVYVLMLLITQSPWVLVVPFVLVVLDQFFISKRIDVGRLKWLGLYIVPIIFYLFTYFDVALDQRVTSRTEGGQRVTMNTQAFIPVVEGYPYTTYLMTKLYLFPKDLTVYYDGMEVTTFLYVAMYVVFATYVAATLYTWRKNRKIAGILIMFPFLLAPAYSPVKITWFLAERYMYSGSAFFGILVGMLIVYLENRAGKKYLKFMPYAVFAVVLVALSYRTVLRNDDWQDTETLSYANMKVSPLSVRPYNDVGGHFFYEGDYARAIYFYEEALKVVPSSGTAINNLGFMYLSFGPLIYRSDYEPFDPDPELAADYVEFAKRIMSTSGGEARTASYFFNRAAALDPNSVEAASYTADMYLELGIPHFAEQMYRRVLEIDKGNEYALKQLIAIQAAQGGPDLREDTEPAQGPQLN